MSQPHEPPLRGPWPAWALAGAILLIYAVQQSLLPNVDVAAARFGFVSSDLLQGRWWTLVSALFIHGGWGHAVMNAVGALAFGAPVARLLGTPGRGLWGFLLFYLLCGVLGNLGQGICTLRNPASVIGASGAVAGLFGAASRLIEHRPALSPLASRSVVGSAAAWIFVNMVMGLSGYAPGIGFVQIAWQAHIAGYGAGVLLIGPWRRIFAVPGAAPLASA